VFPAPGADYEDFHIRGILSSISARRKKRSFLVARSSFRAESYVTLRTQNEERATTL
jgi:hypothetical protein